MIFLHMLVAPKIVLNIEILKFKQTSIKKLIIFLTLKIGHIWLYKIAAKKVDYKKKKEYYYRVK